MTNNKTVCDSINSKILEQTGDFCPFLDIKGCTIIGTENDLDRPCPFMSKRMFLFLMDAIKACKLLEECETYLTNFDFPIKTQCHDQVCYYCDRRSFNGHSDDCDLIKNKNKIEALLDSMFIGDVKKHNSVQNKR